MRIVVLGGTGLLGLQIAKILMHSSEMRPVTVSRRPAVLAGCPHARVDITDRRALERVIDGAAVVVDVAARPISAMLPVTSTLLGAARQGRIGRIVHSSSLAVYGQREGTIDETVPPIPATLDRSAHAKLACERALERAPDAVVLRYGCLISPTAPAWVERFVHLLAENRVGDLGTTGCGVAPLLPVTSAARAVAAVCEMFAPESVINLPGYDGWTWRRYILRLAAAMGLERPERVLHWELPAALLSAPLRRAMGDAAVITPSLARRWSQRLVFSHLRADTIMARPRVASIERIVRDAGALFRDGELAEQTYEPQRDPAVDRRNDAIAPDAGRVDGPDWRPNSGLVSIPHHGIAR